MTLQKWVWVHWKKNTTDATTKHVCVQEYASCEVTVNSFSVDKNPWLMFVLFLVFNTSSKSECLLKVTDTVVHSEKE